MDELVISSGNRVELRREGGVYRSWTLPTAVRQAHFARLVGTDGEVAWHVVLLLGDSKLLIDDMHGSQQEVAAPFPVRCVLPLHCGVLVFGFSKGELDIHWRLPHRAAGNSRLVSSAPQNQS